MRRAGLTRALTACLLLTTAATAGAGEVRIGERTFIVPDGFTIERIAGPPFVDRPIMFDFDEEGRLYVADSSGSNDKVEKQLAERPHRIVRLEDLDGDGRYDRRTIFADRMMFPEGTMWLDGSLYVAAPPSIWKLTDTDGDGVADRREEWFQGKTLTGCANDLHGPYPGPDGWIYWCKGAFAQQTYARPGRPPLVTRAAHIFRCRPDGSGIEPVLTGGMDNPVDVVFTPGGERILSCTFFQHPGGGQRDGLIHAIYGGVYGKVHDVIDGHPRTGRDVMPVLDHLGPAAPCGLARYESTVFGEEYRDNLFACLFNMRKVTRHVLVPSGSTFTTRDEDFVVSPDQDFHPTDVQEDADGSLVVADTGGWYKLCCPSSQLVKPDVLGALYRVRRAGTPPVIDPRGIKVFVSRRDPRRAPPLEDYVALLGDSRPAIRWGTVGYLVQANQPDVVLRLLRKASLAGASPMARRNAVWTMTRIDTPLARPMVREYLDDPDETVRQVAIHSVSVRRDRDAVTKLLPLLTNASAANRRAAAEALGRLGDASAVPALLEAAGEPADRVLEHSLTYAFIEIGDRKATEAGLASESAGTRRAALVALDQMAGGALEPSAVLPMLTSSDPALRETASWVAGRHPEWADALAGWLRNRLDAGITSREAGADLEEQLARFARSRPIQELLAARLTSADTPRATRLAVLHAMAQSGLKPTPAAWREALAQALKSSEPDLIRAAIAACRATAPTGKDATELRSALFRLADDASKPAELRLDALAAVPGNLSEAPAPRYEFLRSRLAPDQAVSQRMAAADILARSALGLEQLAGLVDPLKAAGPLEVDRLLAVFDQAQDDALGVRLVAALVDSPAMAALRVETLKPHLDKFGPRVQEQANVLYSKLRADDAKQRARLEELVKGLGVGDVRRGQALFNGPKATCASCHAIGYLGGKVGPDLTKIGAIRTERDLLESIVFPSASFVRSYEPVVVATRDGRVASGILRKDSADEVVLATNATEEAHIPRDDVEEMRPGTVSVMPAGLDQQLTAQELADLVAFLKACR